MTEEKRLLSRNGQLPLDEVLDREFHRCWSRQRDSKSGEHVYSKQAFKDLEQTINAVVRVLRARMVASEKRDTALRAVAERAMYKLQSLGRIFSGPSFTDRGGDGPICLDIAKDLKEALK